MDESLLKISYTMTLEEIEAGFKLFQRKYSLKRSILFTVVYSIALVFGVDFIIRGAGNFYGYVLTGLALGLIFWTWYRPVYIRKKMIASISSMAQETYISEFFGNRIEITTQILDKITEENVENSAEKVENIADNDNKPYNEDYEIQVRDDETEDTDESEKTEEIVKTTLNFGTELMDALENEEMFLLFVNKSLIYIYPKRCLEENEQETLRNILKDKAILA